MLLRRLGLMVARGVSSAPQPRPARPVTARLQSKAHQALLESLQGRSALESAEWEALLASASPRLTQLGLPSTVVQLCGLERNLPLAKNFLEHLETKGHQLNAGTLSAFLKLCSMASECPEDDIYKYYNMLRERLPGLMDARTAQNATRALCRTKRWAEAADLPGAAQGQGASALAVAAFRHDHPEQGWEWLEASATTGFLNFDPEVWGAWLKQCPPEAAMGEKLLDFLHRHNVPIARPAAEYIEQFFSERIRPPWRVHQTKISKSGTCQQCRKELAPIFISESEFTTLSTAFFERVMVGKDVFARSTPQELERFSRSLDDSLPYDVVLDALNIGYTQHSRAASVDLLADVVRYFVERDMRVVIVGRSHMRKWNPAKISALERHCRIFLVDNISQDDPFVLHAAMRGGRETSLVSRDLMRGHRYLLRDPELARLFKRWQLARQFSLRGATVVPPLRTLPFAQPTSDAWHVPYEEVIDATKSDSDTFRLPATWLCLSKHL